MILYIISIEQGCSNHLNPHQQKIIIIISNYIYIYGWLYIHVKESSQKRQVAGRYAAAASPPGDPRCLSRRSLPWEPGKNIEKLWENHGKTIEKNGFTLDCPPLH